MTWVSDKADERLAQMEQALGAGASFGLGVVMTTMTDPDGDSSEELDRWERTCDNCGTYCPDDAEFYTGTISRMLRGSQVVIAFGACPRCASG